MSILTQPVLKLNRLWQAIGETNVETAFLDLCRGALMAMDTSIMKAVGWDEWIKLPIREGDPVIQTVRGPVRVPRVVLCVAYAGRPMVRPKLDNHGVRQRDGSRCQVTGEYAPDGNVDHLQPVSRGGRRKDWKNMAWMRRDLNTLKGNRTLQEMGWKLIRPPAVPKAVPAGVMLKPRFPEWEHFLNG